MFHQQTTMFFQPSIFGFVGQIDSGAIVFRSSIVDLGTDSTWSKQIWSDPVIVCSKSNEMC